ncbi:hypothetical protein BDR26DRAFT_853324 [Obelidium mucronatum]|nr:hypothetical protein BDR26DRAFT_853324 [Obelidium mucronatum]
MVHIHHKSHANHTRLILAFSLLVFFTTVIATRSNSSAASISIHEPLIVAANVSSAIANDVVAKTMETMDWGVFSAMGKLYNAYLFVVRTSLVFSAVILFYPEAIGLGDDHHDSDSRLIL